MLRDFLLHKKRIVIKIGTSSLTYANGKINFRQIELLARVLSDIANSGKEVMLVSSGAIAAGAGIMGLSGRPSDLAGKQALAAIGQAELIKIYQTFFNEYHQKVAQILITKNIVFDELMKQNAQNTFEKLLEMGIIPIINENDTVATDEIEFGDNDTLSAMVAITANADLLIILSDIDGLYSANPKENPEAELILQVDTISPEIERLASGTGSVFAKGGMTTKITAAKLCVEKNIDVIITNGMQPKVLYKILEGQPVGTLFKA